MDDVKELEAFHEEMKKTNDQRVQEYGSCPVASTTTAAMMAAGPSLHPSKAQEQQMAVMPLLSPCMGPICAWWFQGMGKPMCSIKALAYGAKAVGDRATKQDWGG